MKALTVKEFIEALSKEDQEALVFVEDWSESYNKDAPADIAGYSRDGHLVIGAMWQDSK